MDLKRGFRALVREIVGMPADEGVMRIDRLAHYRARVDACSADGSTLDVTPENPLIPREKNVRLRVGIPGASAIVQPGCIVWLGWDGGNPKSPHCEPTWEQGATVTKLVLNAQTIELGADSLVALANGVVIGQGVDAFTGLTYGVLGNASHTIFAKP